VALEAPPPLAARPGFLAGAIHGNTDFHNHGKVVKCYHNGTPPCFIYTGNAAYILGARRRRNCSRRTPYMYGGLGVRGKS